MAHGTPDWGARVPKSTVYGGIDLAEHAARVGSQVTFDRRGDVLWFDDFSGGINKWVVSANGTGSSYSWSAESSEFGPFSAKLVCGTEVWGGGSMLRAYALPALSQLGFEFAINRDADISQLTFGMVVYDGTITTSYTIRYTAASGLFEYQTTGGGYPDLTPTKILHPYRHLFHILKLVINPTNKKYVRLIADNIVYDLADLDAWQGAPVDVEYARCNINVVGTLNENAVAYIDRAILTQNEP